MPRRVKTPELESIVDNMKIKLSSQLKISRENMHFTQQTTSEMIGIELSHYQNIEHGKALPSIEVLCRMADILHFSIDSLLTNDTESKKVKSIEKLLAYCTDENLDVIESVIKTLISRNKNSSE